MSSFRGSSSLHKLVVEEQINIVTKIAELFMKWWWTFQSPERDNQRHQKIQNFRTLIPRNTKGRQGLSLPREFIGATPRHTMLPTFLLLSFNA